MTTQSIFDQYRRIERELREASKPEVSIEELRKREEIRLGVKISPAKGEKNG